MNIQDWCAQEARVKIHLTGGQGLEGKLLSYHEGVLCVKAFTGVENLVPLAAVQRLERLADPVCGAKDY